MEVQTFCRVCNAMCGLVVTVDGTTVSKVRGDESHALSRGYSCPKGRAIASLHHDERRLNHPLVRRNSVLEKTTWDSLLDDLADRIAATVKEHGPDSVAMYLASGSAFDTAGRRAAERFLTLLDSKQKYTATTIDTPSKPLVAEHVGGWSGLTPVWDHESSALLLLFGSNPVVSHGHSNAMPDPVRRFREFQSKGGSIWVLDPRCTETAVLADHHLQLTPGTDWIVLGWLVRQLLVTHPEARTLSSRATGAEALIESVASFDDALVSTKCGVSIDDLESLHRAILDAGRVSALTGTGVSMSATANVTEYLLWALHIVTDSYDQQGGMWFNPGFLTQLDTRDLPHSDGAADPGPQSRPSLPRRFGEYPCSALVSEIEAGVITTLIVVGGNPVTALPESARTIAALKSLSTLLVIDVLPTETTDLATHVLPAVDQLERADLTWLLDSYQLAVAAQYSPAIVEPIAERKPMWWMFASLAERLGLDLMPKGESLSVSTDETFLAPLIRRSRNPELLRDESTLAFHSGAVFGWVQERVLPQGKWRLDIDPIISQLNEALSHPDHNSKPALVLIPTRRLRMMNSQFRMIEMPDGSGQEPSIRVSARTAASIGSPPRARLSSQHGSLEAVLVVDEKLGDDVVTLSHGFGDANVCALTSSDNDIDPLTGMVLQSGIEVTLHAQM